MSVLTQQAAPNAIPPANEYSTLGRSEAQIGGQFSGHPQISYIRDKLSVDSHRYSRHPKAGDAEYAMHCRIDLDFTDAAILESLKIALPLWRKAMNDLTGREHISQKQSDVEFSKLASYPLIPIMDIELWKSQNDVKLSQVEIVRLLDPDREDADDTYRKTWKPTLKEFLTPEGHRRLYAAAYTRQLKQLKG